MVKTNIIVIGLGNSGSSAVQELLMEYDNIGKFRYEEPGWSTGEMNHFRLPGMIADRLSEETDKIHQNNLDKFLKENRRPIIPWRFLIRRYLPDKLVMMLKGNAYSRSYALHRIKEFRHQQLYYDSLMKINSQFKIELDYDKRIALTREWLEEVNSVFGENKNFVIHKPILHECHLDIWPKVFKPFKVIFVFREPEDQLSSILGTSMMFRNMPWQYQMIFGMDKGNRRMFHTLIDTTIMRMSNIEKIRALCGEENFLSIDFEGLVNNYENYKKIIENFLLISSRNHILQKKYFNPQESILTLNKYIELLDKTDQKKMEPLKEWYEREKLQFKKRFPNI